MIIQVENLVKKYGELTAVDDISFAVAEGALFSFLGTNGAGKSTTINVLTTLMTQTSGKALIDGTPIEKAEKIREKIGVVFQDSVLDKKLSVRENLLVRGGMYGHRGAALKSVVDDVIKMTDIGGYAQRRYEKLSGGQRRRADIARAIINRPKLIFMDEPTTGLDPKTRQDIWDCIRNLQKQHNMTVFLTTHYMEEASDSDDIVIIHNGKIKAQGTPEALKEAYAFDRVKIILKDGGRIEERLEKSTDAIPIIEKHKNAIEHLEVISGTLDDVFINLAREEEANNAAINR